MKVCARCGNSNKDKATQCFYCKVDLIAEGTFVSVPNPSNRKKLLSLLLLIPAVLCLVAAIYFILPYDAFVAMNLANLYMGRDMEIGFLLMIAAIACIVIMIVLLTRDPSRRVDDEADEAEDPTYLMEMTTEEELAKQEEEAAQEETVSSEEEVSLEAGTEPAVAEGEPAFEAVEESTEQSEVSVAEESEAPVAEQIRTPVTVLQDNMTVQTLYSTLEAGAYGLDVTTTRSLLSAMAVSHLLVVRKRVEEDATALAQALARAFDTPACVVAGNETWEKPEHLYSSVDAETNVTSDSEFIHGAYRASANREKVYFVTVTGLRAQQLPAVFSEMIPFFQTQDRTHFLRQKSVFFGGFDNSVDLCDNLWILAVIDETDDVQIPSELEGLYAEIPFRADLTAVAPEDVLPDVAEVPSVALFHRMVITSDDEYGFSEELWKKLDLLEELLHKEIGFSFTNKLVRKMERFSGLYLATGGKETEALDSVLAVGLIPMIATDLKEYAKRVDEVEEPLHHFLDRVFGIDNLPLTADTLRVLGIA